jgi:hypothetical protein
MSVPTRSSQANILPQKHGRETTMLLEATAERTRDLLRNARPMASARGRLVRFHAPIVTKSLAA